MRKSIAADLAKLEQELSYKTTGYDGTLASGKTWYGVRNKINILFLFFRDNILFLFDPNIVTSD